MRDLKIKIGKKLISNKSKTYFIADIAANHDGKLNRALKLIKLAAAAGVEEASEVEAAAVVAGMAVVVVAEEAEDSSSSSSLMTPTLSL